jgi:hypothetical protein
MTEFISIAEKAVIRAVIVIRRILTHVVGFVTAVIRTIYPITAVHRSASNATREQIAYFHTVTILSIVTDVVVGCVCTGIIHFVTGIKGTLKPIVTVDEYSRLACTCTITGFFSVAVLVVGT